MKWRILSITFSLLLSINFVFAAEPDDIVLKEKIGQMLIFGFKGTELQQTDSIVQDILAKRVGGVVLYRLVNKNIVNIVNPQQLKKLTTQLQDYAKQAAQNLPLFISIDYEGGNRVRRLIKEDGFPDTLSADAIGKGSEEQAATYAELMAQTLEDNGINLNFAPVIDVNVDPKNYNPIAQTERVFSMDPERVTTFARIFSKAYKKHHILCTYKHFPGHGSSAGTPPNTTTNPSDNKSGDTHLGPVDITETWDQEKEWYPYQQLLRKPYSCSLVMTAHVINTKIDNFPASLSKVFIKDKLRNELGFNGVVISDDILMKAITSKYTFEEAIRYAVNAGTDMLIFSGNSDFTITPEKVVDIIYKDVQTGKIRKSRINEAYARIMKLKQQLRPK